MTSKKDLAKAKKKELFRLSYYLTTRASNKYAKAKLRQDKREAKKAALELAKLMGKKKKTHPAVDHEMIEAPVDTDHAHHKHVHHNHDHA